VVMERNVRIQAIFTGAAFGSQIDEYMSKQDQAGEGL
jgi:hypothetical protein